MQIERIEELRLTRTDEAQVAELMAKSFDTDFGSRSFYQQRHNLRLVAREDDRIVGHMGLCYRAIRLGERLVDIVGLGDVATHPASRGKGVASALMTAAIEEAKASPAAFFVLFGNRPLYAGRGFVAKGNAVRYVHLEGARTGAVAEEASRGLMVMPLGALDWDDSARVDLVGHSF